MTASLAGAVGLHPTRRGCPWSGGQFAAVVVANSLALVLALIGWLYSSGKTHPGDQIAGLNVSFAGVVLAIAANGFFLARGRQTVRLAMPVALAGTSRSIRRSAPISTSNGSAPWFVSVPGTRRYHRPGCALVAGKAAQEATVGHFAGTGRVPCEVCGP